MNRNRNGLLSSSYGCREVVEIKIRDAYFAGIMVCVCWVDAEVRELRVSRPLDDELVNGLVSELHRLQLFINLDEIFTPRRELIDAVHQAPGV